MDHVFDSPDPPPSYRKMPASDNARRKFPVIRRRKHEEGSLAWIETQTGILAVRDAIPADIDAYVNYWHYRSEKIKNLLGIDAKKLGTPEDSRKRFLKMIRIPGAEQADVIFTITLNSKVIGYTNVNRYGPRDNYVHLHTYSSYIRSTLEARPSTVKAKTGAGPAALLIGLIGMYFNLLPIFRAVFQTQTRNRWINSALDLYMPPAETKYLESPAGLAAPGEYHLRYVHREDVPWMLSRAELLSSARDVRTAANEPRLLPPQAAPGTQPPLGLPTAYIVPSEVLLTGR